GPPGRGLSGRRYTTEPGAALLVPGRGGAVLSAVALAVHVVGACGTPVAGHTPTVGGGGEWAADRFVGAFGGVDRQGSHCGLFLADHACLGVGRGWSARPDPGAGADTSVGACAAVLGGVGRDRRLGFAVRRCDRLSRMAGV